MFNFLHLIMLMDLAVRLDLLGTFVAFLCWFGLFCKLRHQGIRWIFLLFAMNRLYLFYHLLGGYEWTEWAGAVSSCMIGGVAAVLLLFHSRLWPHFYVSA